MCICLLYRSMCESIVVVYTIWSMCECCCIHHMNVFGCIWCQHFHRLLIILKATKIVQYDEYRIKNNTHSSIYTDRRYFNSFRFVELIELQKSSYVSAISFNKLRLLKCVYAKMRTAWKCAYSEKSSAWKCVYCGNGKLWKCVISTERVKYVDNHIDKRVCSRK